jgi:hypothetical protein
MKPLLFDLKFPHRTELKYSRECGQWMRGDYQPPLTAYEMLIEVPFVCVCLLLGCLGAAGFVFFFIVYDVAGRLSTKKENNNSFGSNGEKA